MLKEKPFWCGTVPLAACKALDGTKDCFGPHGTRVKNTILYLECFSNKERKKIENRVGTIVHIYGMGVDVQWDGEEVSRACIIDLENI